MGENICKLSDWQGINPPNILIPPTAKKNKKWAKDLETFLQRKHTDGQKKKKNHENMLNIANY